MSRNVCLLISLPNYTLFTSTHTLHCVGQDIPFGSELQNHVPPQESARVQYTHTHGAPQSTWFTYCLGNRFTNRWKHEKIKIPNCGIQKSVILLTAFIYQDLLTLLTWPVIRAAGSFCGWWCTVLSSFSSWAVHIGMLYKTFQKLRSGKLSWKGCCFLVRISFLHTFSYQDSYDVRQRDCKHTCSCLSLELSFTKSEVFLQSLFPPHMRVRLLRKCYFTANGLHPVPRAQGLGNTCLSGECILSILKHLTWHPNISEVFCSVFWF